MAHPLLLPRLRDALLLSIEAIEELGGADEDVIRSVDHLKALVGEADNVLKSSPKPARQEGDPIEMGVFDAAFVVREDGAMEFYIPGEDEDSFVGDPALVVTALACLAADDERFQPFMQAFLDQIEGDES